jgi:methylmalonyl-CoA mutase
LLARLVRQFPQAQIAVVAMDPTRRRSGGALLGDRIRMNSLSAERSYALAGDASRAPGDLRGAEA